MKDEARRADGRSEYFLRKRPEHEWIIMDAPALVDAEIWELSQQRLATNQSELGGRPARKYLLSGLILCPVGGSRMMYRRSGHGHNYQCPKSHKDALLQCYNALRYEALVVRALLAVVERPELVEHAIRAYTDQPGQGHTDTKESVSAELSKLAIQEKATVRAQIAGVQAGADPTLYDTVFAEINLKRDALKERLATIETRAQEISVTDVADKIVQAICDVKTVLTAENIETDVKNRLLHTVIKAIHPTAKDVNIQVIPLQKGETVACVTI